MSRETESRTVASAVAVLAIGAALWACRDELTGDRSRRLNEATLDAARGANPGYRSVTGGDFCSGSNLEGAQVAAYDCSSNNGSTCIVCTPAYYDLLSALSNAGNQRMQSTGGSPQSCSSYRKKAGTCRNDGYGYYCANPMDLDAYCTGTFPPMQAQYY